MRRSFLIAGMLAAILWIVGREGAWAQDQSRQNPPSQSPEAAKPQKKQAGKAASPATSSSKSDDTSTPSVPSGQTDQKAGASGSKADDNAFPEDVSRRAAKPADETPASPESAPSKPVSKGPHSAADDNPFPEDVSRGAAKQGDETPVSPKPASTNPASDTPPSTGGDNPFPEAVSRNAGKSSGNSSEDTSTPTGGQPGRPGLPSGVSSSQSSGLLGDVENGNPTGVTDPVRAKKDIQVGDFYLLRGNPEGAYTRYQDAVRSDPTNIDAIFGVAEAAAALKKFPEAQHNYQLYLKISPDGAKSKKALKALESLPINKPAPGR